MDERPSTGAALSSARPPPRQRLPPRPHLLKTLSVTAGDVGQSIPAGRRRRCRRPSVCGRDGAAAEAAARGRNQSRGCRGGRRAVRCQCKAGRLYADRPPAVAFRLCSRGRVVRTRTQIHARRFRPDCAPHRWSDGARRQRQAALSEPEGTGRRRQEAAERPDLQLIGALRRAASAGGAVHAGSRHPDAASADRRRRAGAERDPRRQCAGAGIVDRGRQCAGEGWQSQSAGLLLVEARRLDARRADAEGTRLRRRVFNLGRPVCTQGHA